MQVNGLVLPKINGINLQLYEEVKYLEVILDKTSLKYASRIKDETSPDNLRAMQTDIYRNMGT